MNISALKCKQQFTPFTGWSWDIRVAMLNNKLLYGDSSKLSANIHIMSKIYLN